LLYIERDDHTNVRDLLKRASKLQYKQYSSAASSSQCSCSVPSVLAVSAGPFNRSFKCPEQFKLVIKPRWYSMKLAVQEEHLAMAVEGDPPTMAATVEILAMAMAMAMAIAIATATVGLPRRQHWS
jgi:hypothetical protein